MSRIAYVNGRYVPHAQAAVHIEDRGYQFADGVYEVVAVFGGNLVDEAAHLDRLERSLSELRMDARIRRGPLRLVMREMVHRNRLRDGLVYLQVTRGVAPRNHAFPGPSVRPALVMTARTVQLPTEDNMETGVEVVTVPDQRWARRDIKSVSLLPNVLGKQAAAEQGAFEAWMVDQDGNITEGTSSNAWIVTQDNRIVTRQTGNEILTGITRQSILAVARDHDLLFEERPFSVEEAKSAREAFMSNSTAFVLPVTQIDDRVIGNGVTGTLTRALRHHYLHYVKNSSQYG